MASYCSTTEKLVTDYLVDEGVEHPLKTELRLIPQAQQFLFHEPMGRLFATAEEYARDKNEDLMGVDDVIGRKHPSQSLLFVPIRYAGEPLGILSTQSYRPYAYSQRHLEMLKEIGVQAGIAITNAQLTTDLRDALQQAQEANARLEALATTDPLTGLPNRQALLKGLGKEMARARRSGHPFSVVFFDGDHFKRVNDTYGHAVGDQVLCELGARVNRVLRGGDTLGRFGGEEFLVILPETNTAQASTVTERLRETVASYPFVTWQVEGGIPFTMSMGIATFPNDGHSSEELVEQADQAMYWAKRLGRNQVRTAGEARRFSQDSTLVGTIDSLKRHQEAFPDGMDREQSQHTNQLGAVYSLMGLLELRDHGISQHSYEVSDLATAIAQEMGLEQQTIRAVSTAALLHDIGKIAIPDRLLQKEGLLSQQEWALIRRHPELGVHILEGYPALQYLIPAVGHHHERWDGKGYPERLAGERIPQEARIIAVAEAYQAMLTDRPYQAGRAPWAAMRELERCAGAQFDPVVVKAALVVLTRQQDVSGLHEPAETV